MDFMTMIELKKQFNHLTKSEFNINSLTLFENWLTSLKSFDDDFARIPKSKTVSGKTEMLSWF